MRTLYCLVLIIPAMPSIAQEEPILERIEWTDVWVVDADQPEARRVLFIGDSIVRGYYDEVEKLVPESYSCARYTTSLFLSNPDYLAELRILLQRYDFEIIHVNNGLHGFGYTEDQYREGLEQLLQVLKEEAPESHLIWCMSTPIRDSKNLEALDERNDRVLVRNRIALEMMAKHGIRVTDLYAAVVDHPDYFSQDGVHFTQSGQEAQAQQVYQALSQYLSAAPAETPTSPQN